MKRIPKWFYYVGLIVFAILAYLFISSSLQAQPLTFESKAALQSATYSSGVLTIKVAIPAAEAQMIQKMMGKASSAEAVTQIGQNAADDVKKLSERMFHKQRDDARDFIPQSAIDAAIEARKVWEQHVKDSIAAAQPVGSLHPDTEPDADGFYWRDGVQYTIYKGITGIGKAHSPRQEFLAGIGDSYNHGYPESWGWIYFVLYEVPKYIVYTIVGYGVFLLGHYIAHEMFEWK